MLPFVFVVVAISSVHVLIGYFYVSLSFVVVLTV